MILLYTLDHLYWLFSQVQLFSSLEVLLLGRGSVHSNDNGVIAFIGLQGDLFLRLHFLSLHFLNFSCEHGLSLGGGVNAVGLKVEQRLL